MNSLRRWIYLSYNIDATKSLIAMYKISFKYACLWSSLNVAYVTIIDRQDSAEMTEEIPMISCPFVIPKSSISIYVSSGSI